MRTKKYKKFLIAMGISLPIFAITITTPIVLASNSSIKNSLSSSKFYGGKGDLLEPKLISSKFELQGSVETATELVTKQVKITLIGENLSGVSNQDINIISNGKAYSNFRIDKNESNEIVLFLFDKDLQMGKYQIKVREASIEHDFYPSFPSLLGKEFNWGETIKLQVNNALLVDTTKIKITNDKQKDVTNQFSLSVNGSYLTLNIKPDSQLALTSDSIFYITLFGNSNPKKITIKAKNQPIIKSTSQKIDGNQVTLEVFGNNLLSQDIESKLVVIQWNNDSGTIVTQMFKKEESLSSNEKLVLKATIESANNSRFDIRLI